MSSRISREELYAELAKSVAKRGTCPRAHVGCVLVREGRIVATGYNGAPAGQPHCTDEGCIIEHNHCVRSIHAEEAAISFAARLGISLGGCDMFVTLEPCGRCRRLAVNAGIVNIHWETDYNEN